MRLFGSHAEVLPTNGFVGISMGACGPPLPPLAGGGLVNKSIKIEKLNPLLLQLFQVCTACSLQAGECMDVKNGAGEIIRGSLDTIVPYHKN